jgi:hypothetical protein
MALLPGSSAINAGSSSYGGSTDQRSKPRVGATDIGAFESQGFSIAITTGNNQIASVNTTFAQLLLVTVTANNLVEPVAGGLITFTAPSSGASAVLKGSPASIGSGGEASVTATANAISGTYTVTASATGIATPAKFTLSNVAPRVAIMSLAGVAGGGSVSPQQAIDLAWSEVGLTWDLLLAGGSVQVLVNNPQAVSLANAIDQNSLYHALEGWLMANALVESILAS